MNQREANRRAIGKWGPLALAVRASNNDRHQRFRLGWMREFQEGQVAVQMAGIGDSWEAAFANAEENPIAKKWENELRERLKAKLEESTKRINETIAEAEKSEGSTNQQ